MLISTGKVSMYVCRREGDEGSWRGEAQRGGGDEGDSEDGMGRAGLALKLHQRARCSV